MCVSRENTTRLKSRGIAGLIRLLFSKFFDVSHVRRVVRSRGLACRCSLVQSQTLATSRAELRRFGTPRTQPQHKNRLSTNTAVAFTLPWRLIRMVNLITSAWPFWTLAPNMARYCWYFALLSRGVVSHRKYLVRSFVRQVIDRKVRELCVDTEVLPLNTTPAELRERGFR